MISADVQPAEQRTSAPPAVSTPIVSVGALASQLGHSARQPLPSRVGRDPFTRNASTTFSVGLLALTARPPAPAPLGSQRTGRAAPVTRLGQPRAGGFPFPLGLGFLVI